MATQFDDVLFPEDISYGSSGGPGFLTDTLRQPTGALKNTQRWDQPLWSYDVSYGIKSHKQLAELRNFFLARRGALRPFRYKDWSDCTSSASGVHPDFSLNSDESYPYPYFADQPLLPLQNAPGTWQLTKAYESGPTTFHRAILAPRTNTIRVSVDGTETTSFSVNSQGIVTLTAAIDADVRWGGFYDHVVQFGAGADQLFSASLDSFGDGSQTSIPLLEVRSEALVPAGWYFGGATECCLESDRVMSYADGMFQLMDFETAGTVTLPDPTDLPLGRGPTLATADGSATVTVKTDQAATLVTLAAGKAATVFLYEDGADTLTWAVVGG